MSPKHFFAGLLLLLAGCAAPPPAVTIKADEFSPAIRIDGPAGQFHAFSGTDWTWRLRSWVDKPTRQVTHQLYVFTIVYGDYQYFQLAADDTAQSLPVTVIDRSIDRSADCRHLDCEHYETFGIAVDDAMLRTRAETGYRVKVTGRRGEELILPLSPTQIRLQLAAVDRLILSPAPAAAPAR